MDGQCGLISDSWQHQDVTPREAMNSTPRRVMQGVALSSARILAGRYELSRNQPDSTLPSSSTPELAKSCQGVSLSQPFARSQSV